MGGYVYEDNHPLGGQSNTGAPIGSAHGRNPLIPSGLGMGYPTQRQRMVPNLDPRQIFTADRVKEMDEGKAKDDEKPPQKAGRTDASAYESLPDDLKRVIARTQREGAEAWWSALGTDLRVALVKIYNRMVGYGVWGYVKSIKDAVPGEKSWTLGPIDISVAGLTASILLEVYDAGAFAAALTGTGKFGVDDKVTALMHPGAKSFREAGGTGSLHISVKPSAEGEAHIDKVAAVTKPKQGQTRLTLTGALSHHLQELFPEFFRASMNLVLAKTPAMVADWIMDQVEFHGTGGKLLEALKAIPRGILKVWAKALDITVASTTLKPATMVEHIDPSQRPDPIQGVVGTVKEWRFGGGKKDPKRDPEKPPPGNAAVEEHVAQSVQAALGGISPKCIIWKGAKGSKDDYADVATVGGAIAQKIMYVAKYPGDKATHIDVALGESYANLSLGAQKQVKAQLEVVGKAAHSGLVSGLRKGEKPDEDMIARVMELRAGKAMLGSNAAWFGLQ